ncbi:hypothetical protein SIO70_22755 [Chitinophaga sancti]|nr:hypothetical protein [Chitinophaga sancti]WPQ61184.1 hypothetical protein SIO70_22755 [Chitinophaga sancti]
METMEAAGDMFDTSVDFIAIISQIGQHYISSQSHFSIFKNGFEMR